MSRIRLFSKEWLVSYVLAESGLRRVTRRRRHRVNVPFGDTVMSAGSALGIGRGKQQMGSWYIEVGKPGAGMDKQWWRECEWPPKRSRPPCWSMSKSRQWSLWVQRGLSPRNWLRWLYRNRNRDLSLKNFWISCGIGCLNPCCRTASGRCRTFPEALAEQLIAVRS